MIYRLLYVAYTVTLKIAYTGKEAQTNTTVEFLLAMALCKKTARILGIQSKF